MIRLSLSAVLVITTVLPPLRAQTAVPPCEAAPVGTSDLTEVTTISTPALPKIPSYVDEPLDQLKNAVPHLDPIKLEAAYDAGGAGAATPPQDDTEFVLNKTGVVIVDPLHRMPNLIATEVVRQPVVIPNHKWTDTRTFNYRIVHRKKPSGGDVIDEFRTDGRDQPIDTSANNPNRPLGIGFATMWLFFLPNNLHESRFRFLGEQSIGGHKTYVMAFAQIPKNVGLGAVIESTSGQCSTPLQGVAWIDRSTFQIVRMQSDLLAPLPDIQLYQLRSVLTYGSVKIAGLELLLWLPSDVETTWQTVYRTADESHLYSHYRLFQSKARILPGYQSAPK
jgi:hypothetical protein